MTATRTRAPAGRLSVTVDFARHFRMTAYPHHVRVRGEGVVPLCRIELLQSRPGPIHQRRPLPPYRFVYVLAVVGPLDG
jgi:hypothetical protein